MDVKWMMNYECYFLSKKYAKKWYKTVKERWVIDTLIQICIYHEKRCNIFLSIDRLVIRIVIV